METPLIAPAGRPFLLKTTLTCAIDDASEERAAIAANSLQDSCAHFDVRIAHAPHCFPMRQVPLTAASIAFSKRSANRASEVRSTLVAHVPEYSPCFPETTARQAPVQRVADFAADHPPVATVRPCVSSSVHVPVTVLFAGLGTAVQVPRRMRPLLADAVQPPELFR